MDEDMNHPQCVRDQTSMLTTGAAEALQRIAADIVPAHQRNAFHGVCHASDRNAQGPGCRLLRAHRNAGRLADRFGQFLEAQLHDCAIEALVGALTEHAWKEFWLDSAE